MAQLDCATTEWDNIESEGGSAVEVVASASSMSTGSLEERTGRTACYMIFPVTVETRAAPKGAKNGKATIPIRVGPPLKNTDIMAFSEKLKELSAKNLFPTEDGKLSQFQLATDRLHDGTPRVVMWYARLTVAELETLLKIYETQKKIVAGFTKDHKVEWRSDLIATPPQSQSADQTLSSEDLLNTR